MKTTRVAMAILMGLGLVAAAQAEPSDPASPAGPAAALAYSSAFADYRPWQDIERADWRAMNDTVRDAKPTGAHAGHTAAPAPAPAAAPAKPAPAPAPQAPSGHPGHGSHR